MRGAHSKDDCVWVEPHIEGGFVYIMDNAKWSPETIIVYDEKQMRELIVLLQDAAGILEWDLTTVEQGE